LKVQRCYRSGGPTIYGPEVGDAAVLRVWALAVQRSANGKDGRVVKAAPTVTVGLIVGVFGSDSLDWSLGLVNVDGWVLMRDGEWRGGKGGGSG
jgi:hypothetical protein